MRTGLVGAPATVNPDASGGLESEKTVSRELEAVADGKRLGSVLVRSSNTRADFCC